MKALRNISPLLALLLLTQTPAQRYVLDDSLWIKVILYDFHCDGSNPNFRTPDFP
jgi:hypothetical protein